MPVRKTLLRPFVPLWLSSQRIFLPVRQGGFVVSFIRYIEFFKQRKKYRALGGSASLRNLFPQLFDASEHDFDTHYFYQAAWAARLIALSRREVHCDVGSDNRFIATASAFVDTVWVDVRPLRATIKGLSYLQGDILHLPLADGSVHSLSCLSVLEHVGLGRYGDDLDPSGMTKGAAELVRVLAPGGDLYVSLPVGERVTQFNAHRVSVPSDVVELFSPLELRSFGVVKGHELLDTVDLDDWTPSAWPANGLFHFSRRA